MIEQNYLRKNKKNALNKWHELFTHKEKLGVSILEDASVLPLKKDDNYTLQFGLGGVVRDGKYFPESGIEGRVGGYYEHATVEFCDQKVVYCGALIRQWGHFLVESVSRLWYFLRDDVSVDKYIFISNQFLFHSKDAITGNYHEFF